MRALVLVLLLGCGGKDESTTGGGDSPAQATPRDAVVEAWKKGGLEPSALTAATVAFGKDCQTATVKNIDVLLCNYASAEDALKGEASSAEWMKTATTGTVFIAPNHVLVVIADNKKADPSGKTINQLMKLAPKS